MCLRCDKQITSAPYFVGYKTVIVLLIWMLKCLIKCVVICTLHSLSQRYVTLMKIRNDRFDLLLQPTAVDLFRTVVCLEERKASCLLEPVECLVQFSEEMLGFFVLLGLAAMASENCREMQCY